MLQFEERALEGAPRKVGADLLGLIVPAAARATCRRLSQTVCIDIAVLKLAMRDH